MESEKKNKTEKNIEKNKEKEESNKIKEENEKEAKNKSKEELDKTKEKNKNEVEKFKKPSAWIFIYGENLQGFHTAFILMIIIPISTFLIIRNILRKFNFSKSQQDVFGVIGVLISVWVILVSYTIYYFRNDFYTVFCKKKEKEKEKTKDKSE